MSQLGETGQLALFATGHSNFYCLFLHSNSVVVAVVVVVVRFLVQSLFLSNQPVISCSHCKWRQFEAPRGSLFLLLLLLVISDCSYQANNIRQQVTPKSNKSKTDLKK